MDQMVISVEQQMVMVISLEKLIFLLSVWRPLVSYQRWRRLGMEMQMAFLVSWPCEHLYVHPSEELRLYRSSIFGDRLFGQG